MQGLTRAGINSDLNERRDMALFYLKASGEFDAAVQEWENRPPGTKTWQNIKTFISAEYAKENKQNKLTAKNFKANMIEEQAEATEELIAALTEKHTKQMETLIKSTTEAMKEMMSLIKNEKKEPGKQSDEEKKKKRDERRKRYNDAPICKNCGKKQLSWWWSANSVRYVALKIVLSGTKTSFVDFSIFGEIHFFWNEVKSCT